MSQIIKIDEEKCNGCGLCIINCPEGALEIIDGKAKLVNEVYCDGLGACIGHCPEGAITIEERPREEYSEEKVMENIIQKGEKVILEHLQHLHSHNELEYLNQAINFLKKSNLSIPDYKPKQSFHQHIGGCPGSKTIDRTKKNTNDIDSEVQNKNSNKLSNHSELRQWPVQLALINQNAEYFHNANIVVSADCVPFAFNNFHQKFLKDKILLIFCPKLDESLENYKTKLTHIFKNNNINTITIARMEVPCCYGTTKIVQDALIASGKNIIIKEYIISLEGELI